MHNMVFAISTIPGSSRQILDILRQALLDVEGGGEMMQGHAKAAVISYQNINQTIKKSVILIKKCEVGERPPAEIKSYLKENYPHWKRGIYSA